MKAGRGIADKLCYKDNMMDGIVQVGAGSVAVAVAQEIGMVLLHAHKADWYSIFWSR